MSEKLRCERCESGEKTTLKDVPPTACAQCKKVVTRILDLHHTSQPLCSLDCEQGFWLDIFC